MPHLKKHATLLAVGLGCTGLGAGVSAIASAGASAKHPATTASAERHAAHGLRARGLRLGLGRAVHGDAVISTPQGFRTITYDRGFVQSVSGTALTLREGTATATYRTVTLTIPASARVRNNRQASALSSLTAGEHVAVIQAPNRTLVIARNATP